MQNIFCDTNILLNDKFRLSDYQKVYISIVSVEELDHQKKNEQIGYQARRAIKNIKDATNVEIKLDYGYSGAHRFLEHGNDNHILGMSYDTCIADKDCVFLTDDFNLLVKGQALGLRCKLFEFDKSDDTGIYKGYKELSLNTDEINQLIYDISQGINTYQFVPNEYLILHNIDLKNTIEYRFDGTKFEPLRLPSSKVIKGMNSQQRCALDLLNNKDIPICVINGCYGSGKTYLALRMALYQVNEKGSMSKVLGVREADGEGKEVGFLPGSLEDKTSPFFKPLEQSLDGGEYELTDLMRRGILETNIPYYIKGTTYNDTFIVVDESSDLRMKQIKLIGTRLGKNSRIAFVGDYKQSIYDTSTSNALVQLSNKLKGNPMFGCITLETDVRSEASRIFAEMD